MNKQHVTIILAVIGLIGAAAGGSYAIDFSNTTTGDTNTDNSQTIINEGDTIINEIIEDFGDEFIEAGYDYYCEEVDPDSAECDEYWGE